MTRALVTGGTHGIGLAIARALAADGCDVAICSRTPDRLHRATDLLRAAAPRSEILAMSCDVLDPKQIEQVCDRLTMAWAGTDILICNAGGGGSWGSRDIVATADDVWPDVYQKNAGAATQFTLWAIPHMLDRGWGRVVCITSIGNDRPWFNMAKAAQTALMQTLAWQYARAGITFNCVAPGRIAVGGKEDGLTPEALARYPMGRVGTPEEVASVVRFLCSDEARYVNGACITVDGGESVAR